MQQTDKRNVTFIVDFDVVGKSSVSKLPQPKAMDELKHATDDDSFEDCCPWLDLLMCQCNCTEYPRLMNVVLPNCTADNDNHREAGDASNLSSGESDDDIVVAEDEVSQVDEEEYLEEPCNEREADDEAVPLFTEYVGLRGSSFHADCQRTLKKCREILCQRRGCIKSNA